MPTPLSVQARRYGLATACPFGVPPDVQRELDSFKRWRTVAINLDRLQPIGPGEGLLLVLANLANLLSPVSSMAFIDTMFTTSQPHVAVEVDTFEGNDRSRILGYLGFLYSHVLQGREPSLRHYAHWPWFLRFVSFLAARGVSYPYLQGHILVAVYVLDWLRCQSIGPDDSQRIVALQEALRRLHHQVKWIAPGPIPKTLTYLQAAGLWLDYKTLSCISYELFE